MFVGTDLVTPTAHEGVQNRFHQCTNHAHTRLLLPASFLNSHIHIGSCAWTYEDWRGAFYPQDLPQSRWLHWYARTFNAVEIDSTFYGTPKPNTVARWLGEAPPHFRFTCKAPKAITHEKRLRDCETLMEDFLAAMKPLHGHIGAVLIQLPPGFSPARDATALRDFVLALPHGWRYAIEFRHPDWHQPRFVKLLEEHNICWAWSDMSPLEEQQQPPFGFLPETADFLYVRLMGDPRTKFDGAGKRRHRYVRKLWSRDTAIESWAVRLHKQAEHVKTIYLLVSNHYEGFAPITCRAIAHHLGIEITIPDLAAPEPEREGLRQMKLL
jgi:uncharacterized protein YecE (DUF72 family)